MTPRGKDTKRNRRGPKHPILAAIISDPWRKLVAIGLALLLWKFLDTQVTETVELQLNLIVVDEQDAIQPIGTGDLAVQIPRSKVTAIAFSNAIVEDSAVERVILRFTGPKALIAEVREGTPVRVRRFPEISAPNGPLRFQFSSDDLRLKPELQPLLDQMLPQRVQVDLSRNVSQSVNLQLDAVQVDLTSVPEEDRERILRSRARFYPDTVTLTGPQAALQRALQDPQPFRATMRPMDRDGDRFLQGMVTLGQNASEDLRLTNQSTLNMPLPPDRREYSLFGVVQLDAMSLPEAERSRYRIRLDRNATGTGADAIDATVGPGEGAEIPVRIEVNVFSPLYNLLIAETGEDPERLEDWGRRHVRLDVVLPEEHTSPTATFAARLRLVLMEDEPQPGTYALARKIPLLVERIPEPEGG